MSSLGQLGSLVISLEANMASFQSDLGRASQVATDAMGKIEAVAGMATKALGVLGVAASLLKFEEAIKGSIEMMDNLDKLSKKTGVVVESLSAMKTAAKYSEVGMEEVGSALQKLSKNMVDFDNGSGKAKGAFEALHLSVRDGAGQFKSADQMMLEAAKSLDQYRDGTAKTALEMQLFGKAGANLAGFLKELSERGLDNAKVTTEQAAMAAKYEDNLKVLSSTSKQFTNHIAQELLPSLVEISGAMASASKEGGNLYAAWIGFGGLASKVFQPVTVLLLGMGSTFMGLAADINEWLAKVTGGDVSARFAAEARKQRDEVLKIYREINAIISDPPKPPKLPEIPKKDAPTIGAGDPEALKAYSAYLTALANAEAVVLDASISYAQKVLDDALAHNLVSYSNYFLSKAQLDDSADLIKADKLRAEIKIEDDLIAKHQARGAAEEKVRFEAMAKRATLQGALDAMEAATLGRKLQDREKETASYKSMNDAIMANWADTVGNMGQEGAVLTEQLNRQLATVIQQFELMGTASGDATAKMLRDWISARAAMAQSAADWSRANQDLANQEKQNSIDVTAGILTQWEGRQKLMQIEADNIPILQKLADVKLAAAQADPSNLKLASDARQAALAVADLTAKISLQNREFQYGQRSAIQDYFDSISNGAKQAQTLFGDAFKGLEDVMANFFKTGKLSFTSFIDSLKADLARLAAQKFMVQIVAAVTGSGVAGIASAAGTVAQSGTGIGGWMSASSTLKSGYDAFTGGMSSMYTNAATSSVGQSLGLGTANTFMAPVYENGALVSAGSGQAAAVTELGATVGTALSYVGAGLAGISLGSAIAGDKKVLGLDGTTTSAIGAAVGAAVFGPIGALIGGVAGGIFDAAFGSGERQSGPGKLQGTFNNSGFSGRSARDWHEDGGWFSSDSNGTDYAALAQPQLDAFKLVTTGYESQFSKLAGIIQKPIDTSAWTFSIDQVADSATAQKQILTDLANAMGAQLIPELSQFQKTGESLADTALRLSDEFTITNNLLDLLGKPGGAFGAVGIESTAARESLIALAGGMQNLASITQAYYTNFYTTAEQAANSWKQMDAVFASLNVSAPRSREGFRALVSGLDLSTASGQAAYVALMNIQGVFAQLTPAIGSATSAVSGATDSAKAVSDAFAVLQKSVAAERAGITSQYNASIQATQTAITNLSTSVSNLSALSASLKSALSSLAMPGTEAVERSVAQAQIATALAIAKSGGPLPQAADLQNSLAIVAKPSAALFSNFTDYQRDFLKTSSDITALSTIAGSQLTAGNAQLDALKAQLDATKTGYADNMARLDGVLSKAQSQIDAANGTTTAVMSVRDAIANLASALSLAPTAARQATAATAAVATGALGSSGSAENPNAYAHPSGVNVNDAADSALVAAAKVVYQSTQNGVSTAQFNAAAAALGVSPEGIYAAVGYNGSPSALRQIYGFASGGDHQGGWRIVGENGPELESTGPSRIYSNPQSKSLLDQSALIDEIKAMRQELHEARLASAPTTKAIARVIDRWEYNGLPATRT